MAAYFAVITSLAIIVKTPPGALLAFEIIWVVILTTVVVAEITHHYVVVQNKVAQSLRTSEQSYRTLAVLAERQNQELSLLDDIQTALARVSDPAQIYSTIIESIVRTFGYPRACIYSYNGNELSLEHQIGYSAIAPTVSPMHGLIGRVARTGQPVMVKGDAGKAGPFPGNPGYFSHVCVPLVDQQSVIGVLDVEGSPEKVLDETDLRSLKALSIQAVIAINRSRLHSQIRESEERFHDLVVNLGEGVALIDGKDIFQFANPAAESIFGVDQGKLIGRSIMEFTSPDKFPELLDQPRPQFSVRKGIFELEITRGDREKRNLLVTSTPQIDKNGKFSGTLAVFHDFTERKKMEVELRYLSTHDILTGLYNRAYIETEIARLESGRQYPISIFMIDVDGMKAINDRHGHSAGDELLKRAAGVLKSSFRTEDVVARFGGDEFTILLPGAGQLVSQAVCDRLHMNLVSHNKGYQDIALNLSIGVGIGEVGTSLTEVLKSADREMYEDKLKHHNPDAPL